jgi:hypothetical protein
MADRFILADLTSHRPGFGVQSVITAAARRAQDTTTPSKLMWIIPSHLALAFAAATPVICDGSGPQAWIAIESQIALIKSKTPDAEILVITWDHFVYERAQTSGLGISRLKWFDVLNEERALRTPARPPETVTPQQPVYTAPPSKKEIEDLVCTYLRSIGATLEASAIYRS